MSSEATQLEETPEQLGLTETEEKVYPCLHRRVGLRLTVGTGLDLVRSVQSPT